MTSSPDLETRYCERNCDPLPVVRTRAEFTPSLIIGKGETDPALTQAREVIEDLHRVRLAS